MAAQCRVCASKALTEISITMADGSVVDFTSCHACEAKCYHSAGEELPLDRVLGLAARRK